MPLFLHSHSHIHSPRQLVTFALAQQFGILFRDRMAGLGISSSELTTIINTQIAVSAFTGETMKTIYTRL